MLDAICVGVVTTPATRLRRLPIAPLQYLNSAILTLLNIAEIADIVVGAVTVTSKRVGVIADMLVGATREATADRRVKLRTRWWVLTKGARSEMSEKPAYAMRTL